MKIKNIEIKIYHDDVCFVCIFAYAFARHRMIYKDRVNTSCCFLSAFYSTFSSNDDDVLNRNQSLSIFDYDAFREIDFAAFHYIFYC